VIFFCTTKPSPSFFFLLLRGLVFSYLQLFFFSIFPSSFHPAKTMTYASTVLKKSSFFATQLWPLWKSPMNQKKISVALPEFIHSSPSIPNRQTPTTDYSTNYQHTKTIVRTAAHHPLRHCPLGPDWRRPQRGSRVERGQPFGPCCWRGANEATYQRVTVTITALLSSPPCLLVTPNWFADRV
jgi:hypothetical protein